LPFEKNNIGDEQTHKQTNKQTNKQTYQHVSIYLHAGTKLFPGENSATDLGLYYEFKVYSNCKNTVRVEFIIMLYYNVFFIVLCSAND